MGASASNSGEVHGQDSGRESDENILDPKGPLFTADVSKLPGPNLAKYLLLQIASLGTIMSISFIVSM